jgi:hypothetical protein
LIFPLFFEWIIKNHGDRVGHCQPDPPPRQSTIAKNFGQKKASAPLGESLASGCPVSMDLIVMGKVLQSREVCQADPSA